MRLEMVRAADITAWASAGILSRETRAVGPETLIAATAQPSSRRIGAPMHRAPKVASSSSTA